MEDNNKKQEIDYSKMVDRLELLLGKSFDMSIAYNDKISFKINQLKIKEICKISEKVYNSYLGLITYDTQVEGLDTFDELVKICKENRKNKKYVCKVISFFVKDKVEFICNTYDGIEEVFFKIGRHKNGLNPFKTLNKYNYELFKHVIKRQNCIEEKKKHKYRSQKDKERAEALDEQIRKAKEQINKMKVDRNENLELCDLISALCSKPNSYNLLNVEELTIYQFQDQFQRSQLMENYDIGIRSLLAGASKDDVKIEHYLKRIN